MARSANGFTAWSRFSYDRRIFGANEKTIEKSWAGRLIIKDSMDQEHTIAASIMCSILATRCTRSCDLSSPKLPSLGGITSTSKIGPMA